VLHDREGFLIDRQYPKVVPVRWTKEEVAASEPANHNNPPHIVVKAKKRAKAVIRDTSRMVLKCSFHAN